MRIADSKDSGPQAVLDTIEAVLRGGRKETQSPPSYDLGVDLERGIVWHKGEQLELSRQQYALLAYLYRKEGFVCSPEELLNAVYNENVSAEQAIGDRRLERLVERLRQKIGENSSEPRHLIKVLGRGYRLVANH